MLKPLQRLYDRVVSDREESDLAYFGSLMYLAEMVTKFVVAGMVAALSANMTETVRRERRPYLAGANPARQLSLQPVAVGAAEGGNDLG